MERMVLVFIGHDCYWWKTSSSSVERKEFPDTSTGWCGWFHGKLYWWYKMKRVPCSWIPHVPSLSNLVFSRARIKPSASFCSMIKYSPVQHASSSVFPAAVHCCAAVFRLTPGACAWRPCSPWPHGHGQNRCRHIWVCVSSGERERQRMWACFFVPLRLY